MFEWLSKMSPFEQLTVVSVTITSIAGIVGWMSALYWRVGSIQTNTKATSTKLDTLSVTMDAEHKGLRRDVTDLQFRMVKVEDAIDTERE